MLLLGAFLVMRELDIRELEELDATMRAAELEEN